MNILSFQQSINTDNTTVNAAFRSYTIPTGKSLVLTVEYFAISASGKRISGICRAVFTNVAGTATILGTKVDPYEQKDGSGFSAGAMGFAIATNVVTPTGTGYGGQGATLWTANINSAII